MPENLLHSASTAGLGNHVQQRWSVADETARNALSVSEADLGGVCFQLDNRGLYDLVAVGPASWQRRATNSELATIPAKADAADLTALALSTWNVVADAAALSLLPVSHRIAYVDTFRDLFVYRLESGATVDGCTGVAAVTGAGRWERLCVPNASWLAEPNWRIDSGAGNDENSGRTDAPLKTYAELWRRWAGTGSSVHHTVSKVVDVVSLLATDPLFGRYTTGPDALVNIQAVLPAPAFTGTVSAKADYQVVTAPGTTSKATSTWTVAELNRLVYDRTNNRWAFYDLDLGGGQAKLTPWSTLDLVNGGTSITTGNTTVGATVETYEPVDVAATCNLWADSVRTGQLISLLVQGFQFSGQQSVFGGAKLCFQNCRMASVRYGSAPINFNNCWGLNGAPFVGGPAPLLVCAAGIWRGGLGNNANVGGVSLDLRNGIILESAQLFMNRISYLRLRDVMIENMGGAAAIILTGGSQCDISASNVCGNGNTGVAFDIRGNSKVNSVGTLASQLKLTTGAVQFSLNGTTTTNAFDPTTGLSSLPRANTFANVDATFGAGGFGGSALFLQSGASIGQTP